MRVLYKAILGYTINCAVRFGKQFSEGSPLALAAGNRAAWLVRQWKSQKTVDRTYSTVNFVA